MKIAILGTGLMGSTVVLDLLRSPEVEKVVAVDYDGQRLTALKSRYDDPRLSVHRADVRKTDVMGQLLSGVDVAIGALPHHFAYSGLKAAVQAQVNYVDLIFMWTLDERLWTKVNEMLARKAIMAISPCGLAPGLTNMLARHGHLLFDHTYAIKIYVGGIPRIPKPPLNYRIVFSIESLWDEYTRPAKIVENGRIKTVKPLTGLETVRIPSLGTFEAFYTDGLSTLPNTVRGVDMMYEKTLRWPGHAEQIKTLIECGLLEPRRVEGMQLSPREILNMILAPKLALRDEEDVTILRVDVVGERKGEKVTERFEMIDTFDRKNGITSMARTTAYPASVAAQMVAKGLVRLQGFCPPETVFAGPLFRQFLRELQNRGLEIRRRTISGA